MSLLGSSSVILFDDDTGPLNLEIVDGTDKWNPECHQFFPNSLERLQAAFTASMMVALKAPASN